MDNLDDGSNGGRVTRARRKRLVSIDSEASSRPATPVSPQRTLRGNSKIETDALPKRVTRRNSISNTPQKTPSKIKDVELGDADTPSSRTRRRSMSIQDENTPQKFVKQQTQLTVLPEEDVKEQKSDKKTGKRNTEKASKGGKAKSPREDVVKPSNKTVGRLKKGLHVENDLDSDIEVIVLADTSNDSMATDPLESKKMGLEDAVADGSTTVTDGSNTVTDLQSNAKDIKSEKVSPQSVRVRVIRVDPSTGTKKADSSNNEEINADIHADFSTFTGEESKSNNSKSVTFENSNELEESKISFPKTPAVLKKRSPLLSSTTDNKRRLKLTDSIIESDDDENDHSAESKNESKTENEVEKATNSPKKNPLEKIESRCSTPNMMQGNTMLSNTPTPEKLLRSGKTYGDSPTSEHNKSKEMETEIQEPKEEPLSPATSSKSVLLNKSNESDIDKELVGSTTTSPNGNNSKEAHEIPKDFDKSNSMESPTGSIKNNSMNNSSESDQAVSIKETQEEQQCLNNKKSDESVNSSGLADPKNNTNDMEIEYPKLNNDNDSKEDSAEHEKEIKSIGGAKATETQRDLPNTSEESNENQEKNTTIIEATSFARSWTQSVKKSSSKIDAIESSKSQNSKDNSHQVDENMSPLKSVTENIFDSKLEMEENSTDLDVDVDGDDEHSDNEEIRSFLDGEAKDMGRNYQSGDSMDEEEKEYYAENNLDNDDGESIGSVDSSEIEEEEDNADERNSFIVPSEEETDLLLEYSDDDEHLSDESSNEAKSKKTYKRLKKMSTDTEDEKPLDMEVTHMIDDTIANEQTPNEDGCAEFSDEDNDEDNCAEFSDEEDNDEDIDMENNVNEPETGPIKAKEVNDSESVLGIEQNVSSEKRRRSRNSFLVDSNEYDLEKEETMNIQKDGPEKSRRSRNNSLMEGKLSFSADQSTELEIRHTTAERRRSRNISMLENNDERPVEEESTETENRSPKKKRRSQASLSLETGEHNLTGSESKQPQKRDTPSKKRLSRSSFSMECSEDVPIEKQNTEDLTSNTSAKKRRSRTISSMDKNESHLEEDEAVATPKDTEIPTDNTSVKQRRSRTISSMEKNESHLKEDEAVYTSEDENHETSRRISRNKSFMKDNVDPEEEQKVRRSRSISLKEQTENSPQKKEISETVERSAKKQRRSQNTSLMEPEQYNEPEVENKQAKPAKSRQSLFSSFFGFNDSKFEADEMSFHEKSIMENVVVELIEDRNQDNEHTVSPKKQRYSRRVSLVPDNENNFEKEDDTETKNKTPKKKRRSQNASNMESEVYNFEELQNSNTEKDETFENPEEQDDNCVLMADNNGLRSKSLGDYHSTFREKMKEIQKNGATKRNMSAMKNNEETNENDDEPRTTTHSSHHFHISPVEDNADIHSEKHRRSRKMSLNQAKEASRHNISLKFGEEKTQDISSSEKPCTSRKVRRSREMPPDVDTTDNELQNDNSSDDSNKSINNIAHAPNKTGNRRSNEAGTDKVEQKLPTMKRQRSKSFIEAASHEKPQKDHKKTKLSMSVNYSKQNQIEMDTVDLANTTLHSTKKMKSSVEEKTIKTEAKPHTSTPFNNKKGYSASIDQKDINKILQRCNQMLEEVEKAKKISKENKPTKEKKKRIKPKTSSEMIETAASSSNADNSIKHAALQHALQAAQNILIKPTKKRRREQHESQNDENKYASKRLPMEVLAAVSSSDGDSPNKPKKRKRENVTAQQPPFAGNVYKSISGDLVFESPIHMRHSKKPKFVEIMKTSSGDVRVEPVTPLRKKINNFGFRESPITPQATGWKMRQLMKMNSDPCSSQSSAMTAVERKRKRQTKITEPTHTLPQPTWTKSAGSFKVDKLHHQQQQLINAGATQFEIIALDRHCSDVIPKKSHKQVSRSASGSSTAERAMNFREAALYREDTPREDSHNLLRRKRFVH